MRLKLLILKVILILSFFSNNSFAKNLPPGSGISDVPANVLILLDKSGSMSVRMTSGDGFSYPYSAATCLLYTSPSPRDNSGSRMPSSA